MMKIIFSEWNPDSVDCAGELAPFSEVESTLKSLTGVKPKVVEDFMAIREKYPCHFDVQNKLKLFVSTSIIFFM